MTDLDMTALCAEAITGVKPIIGSLTPGGEQFVWLESGEGYDPLHDDAQAMALVKKFELVILPSQGVWRVDFQLLSQSAGAARSDNVNRAIVECVAKMEKAK
jgi:hypothetical protein